MGYGQWLTLGCLLAVTCRGNVSKRDTENVFEGWYEAIQTGSLRNGFGTYNEIRSLLDDVASSYPTYVKTFRCGKSYQGRDMICIALGANTVVHNPVLKGPATISSPYPMSFVTALHHAREPLSISVVLYYIIRTLELGIGLPVGGQKDMSPDGDEDRNRAFFILRSRTTILLPIVNPDTLVEIERTHNWNLRKNMRPTCPSNPKHSGVDLNRNYSFAFRKSTNGCDSEEFPGSDPFSEPETQTVRHVVNKHPVKLAVHYHAYGNVWTRPYNCCNLTSPTTDQLAVYEEIKTSLNLPTLDSAPRIPFLQYETYGEADDYLLWQHGIISMSPEVGTEQGGFWPPSDDIIPAAEENFPRLSKIILKSGPELTATLQSTRYTDESGQEEGSEPDPHITLTLKNQGLSDTRGAATYIALLLGDKETPLKQYVSGGRSTAAQTSYWEPHLASISTTTTNDRSQMANAAMTASPTMRPRTLAPPLPSLLHWLGSNNNVWSMRSSPASTHLALIRIPPVTARSTSGALAIPNVDMLAKDKAVAVICVVEAHPNGKGHSAADIEDQFCFCGDATQLMAQTFTELSVDLQPAFARSVSPCLDTVLMAAANEMKITRSRYSAFAVLVGMSMLGGLVAVVATRRREQLGKLLCCFGFLRRRVDSGPRFIPIITLDDHVAEIENPSTVEEQDNLIGKGAAREGGEVELLMY